MHHPCIAPDVPRITATVSKEQKEWLGAESDRRDCSEAQVIRELIDSERDAEERPLADRVAELERRLDAVEARRSTSDATLHRLRSTDDVDSQQERSTSDATADVEPTDAYQAALDAVEELEWPAGPRAGEERARAAVRAVIEEIHRQDGASKSDLQESVYPDYHAEFDDRENWWTNFAIQHLQTLRDQHRVVHDTGGGRFTEWRIGPE